MLHLHRQIHPHLSPPQARAFISARVPWVRDRALDHAVEKEKHLLPFHNLKDFFIHSKNPSPSLPPSLPLSSISSSSILLPFHPVRFLRLFPSSFLEIPNPEHHHPHFQPSPSLLKIHEEEQIVHSLHKPDAADRLLRLLMLCPKRRLPLKVVDRLRWDLGLPRDFVTSLLPDYPDYFQIVGGSSPGEVDLEIVCYSKDLAVSEMERYAMKTGGYRKGMALAFPLRFSRGFDMEKEVRKWVEDWQKLPYVSPYEDGLKLPPRSDVWEKWAVGMVHEVLSLMVPKKTEKGNLEILAGHLGLPAGFRKMIMNHPGVFYLSNKLRTQTVVLREAYRRDLLVEKHPLMGVRYQYIHLMRKGKEGSGDGKKKKTKKQNSKKMEDRRLLDEEDKLDEEEHEDEEDEEEEEDDDEEDGEFSEDDESNDEESDDADEDYNASQESVRQGSRGIWVEKNEPRRPFKGRPVDRHQGNTTRRNEMNTDQNVGGRPHGKGNSQRINQRFNPRKRVST